MDRFIVGTGRCGSTLLSRMLAEHPAVLSIFEFFTGLDHARRFAPDPVDGRALASLLSDEQAVVTMMLARGYDVPEIVYPFGRGRYRREGPLPWLCVTMLSRLSDDPDALFDALAAFARGRPRAPLAEHYRAVFAWLAERLGRPVWIERSGSSVEYLGSLAALFPEARFLHLHRDGPETALSMREHHAYRLAVSLLYGARDVREVARAGGAVGRADAPDPVAAILDSRPDPALFGRYWSEQLLRGFRALPALEPSRYRALAFEDLLARPAETLREVAAFFELARPAQPAAQRGEAERSRAARPAQPAAQRGEAERSRAGWITRAAALVEGSPPRRAPALAADLRARLEEACLPGMQLLGRTP